MPFGSKNLKDLLKKSVAHYLYFCRQSWYLQHQIYSLEDTQEMGGFLSCVTVIGLFFRPLFIALKCTDATVKDSVKFFMGSLIKAYYFNRGWCDLGWPGKAPQVVCALFYGFLFQSDWTRQRKMEVCVMTHGIFIMSAETGVLTRQAKVVQVILLAELLQSQQKAPILPRNGSCNMWQR